MRYTGAVAPAFTCATNSGRRGRFPKTREIAVGYDEGFVLELFKRHGLEVAPKIYYESWCSRDEYLSYQDSLVASEVSRD